MLNEMALGCTRSNARRTSCKEVEPGRWLVKCGSALVKIWSIGPRFKLDFYVQGKRTQEMRSTFQDARERAEELAGQLDRAEVHNASLSGQDGVIYARAAAALQPLGLAVDVAALRLVELQAKLGVESLTAAVDFYLANKPGVNASKLVSDVIQDFLAVRAADGCGALHLHTMKTQLKRFSKDFACPIGSVTTDQLSDWLRGLKVAGATRNNFRASLRNLFKYAEAKKLVSSVQVSWDEFNGVAIAKEVAAEITFYTPAELQAILAAAEIHEPRLLAAIALGAFAGLRTAEIIGQRWEDVDLAAGHLRVTRAKGNTPARRLVPLTPELCAWLAPLVKPSGFVLHWLPVGNVVKQSHALAAIVGRFERNAKIDWKKNALRHSSISYRVALTGDVPKVALAAGNSPAKIFSNYLALVTEDAAKAWFAIRPDTAENVSPMPAAKVA